MENSDDVKLKVKSYEIIDKDLLKKFKIDKKFNYKDIYFELIDYIISIDLDEPENAINHYKNEEFLIAESDNFKAVSADFRKDKNRKKSMLVSAFGLVFVGVGALGIAKSGLLKKDFRTAENEVDSTSTTVSDTTAVQPETTAVMTEQLPVSDTPITNGPLYYSNCYRRKRRFSRRLAEL